MSNRPTCCTFSLREQYACSCQGELVIRKTNNLVKLVPTPGPNDVTIVRMYNGVIDINEDVATISRPLLILLLILLISTI